MAPKITSDMTFYQILQMSPEVARVLNQYNLDCGECLGAASETIAQGVRGHGFDIDEILAALNTIFED